MNNYCIVRNTFYDRSVMLRLSLEYQDQAEKNHDVDTFIFLDPHPTLGISKSYNHPVFNKYPKIAFENHKERKSWYLATKYIFDNYDFEYVLSIEDDIIISKDYLKICDQIIQDNIFIKHPNVLYFHIGAWEKPAGDINKIVYSGASSRSILINRNKFKIITDFVDAMDQTKKIGNDTLLSSILSKNNMKAIAPQYNRHGHFGVYGWSSSGVHANINGKTTIFDSSISDDNLYNLLKDSHNELYELLKNNCLSGDGLRQLNKNKNPDYFWDFDPNINFTKIEYHY